MNTTNQLFEKFSLQLRLFSYLSKFNSDHKSKKEETDKILSKISNAFLLLQDFNIKLPNIKEARNKYHKKARYYEGFTLPDLKDTDADGTSYEFVSESPLAVPDKIISKNGKIEECNRQIYHELRAGRDYKKHVRGNTSYVNGAVYTEINSEMKVLPAGVNYDLVFYTVGLKGGFTMVKVRNTKQCQKKSLGLIIDSLKHFFVKRKPNARTTRYSCDQRHKMLAFGAKFEFSRATPYVTNKEFKFTKPQEYNKGRNFDITDFAKAIKETMRARFPWRFQQIVDSENKDCGGSFLGDHFPQTLDLSVNLGNESHYDIRDNGPSIGLWLKAGDRSIQNDNWYFILPNSSIDNSKGVAIQLSHGTLIEWDGTKIKHCTMYPNVLHKSELTESPLIGVLVGSKSKFVDKPISFDVNVGCRNSIKRKLDELK